ncbi:MAG: hypothetical protein Q8M39_03095 [Sulfuricurvum sp.]|nr:hypothetical protein [Sulfuricurvum sp.]
MTIQIHNGIMCHLLVREDPKKIIKRYEIDSVVIDSKIVSESWSEVADFSEIFNAFNRNALLNEVKYKTNEVHYTLILAEKQPPKLAIALYEEDEKEWQYYKFTKVESLLIYNKLTKILNKCDFGK